MPFARRTRQTSKDTSTRARDLRHLKLHLAHPASILASLAISELSKDKGQVNEQAATFITTALLASNLYRKDSTRTSPTAQEEAVRTLRHAARVACIEFNVQRARFEPIDRSAEPLFARTAAELHPMPRAVHPVHAYLLSLRNVRDTLDEVAGVHCKPLGDEGVQDRRLGALVLRLLHDRLYDETFADAKALVDVAAEVLARHFNAADGLYRSVRALVESTAVGVHEEAHDEALWHAIMPSFLTSPDLSQPVDHSGSFLTEDALVEEFSQALRELGPTSERMALKDACNFLYPPSHGPARVLRRDRNAAPLDTNRKAMRDMLALVVEFATGAGAVLPRVHHAFPMLKTTRNSMDTRGLSVKQRQHLRVHEGRARPALVAVAFALPTVDEWWMHAWRAIGAVGASAPACKDEELLPIVLADALLHFVALCDPLHSTLVPLATAEELAILKCELVCS